MNIDEVASTAWRVGFRPEPWEWSGWRWAGSDGRFNGRWDPIDQGLYRTVYAGESLLACLVELLASHRPDETLAADSAHIAEDAEDAEHFPSVAPGELAINEWLRDRIAGTATLDGRFVDITASATVASLHPQFKSRARTYGLKDFDAAALKSAENRSLTQEVAQFLWTARGPGGANLCDGIQFRSRHGDDLLLWAIFERESDGQVSSRVSGVETLELEADAPELVAALSLLGVTPLEKR